MASKMLVVFALCLFSGLFTITLAGNPFHLKGRVYCDTCRAGFETNITTYMAGAKVRVVCQDRSSLQLRYTLDGVTDSTGTYEMKVPTDHGDQKCECTLVSSPDPECAEPSKGRDHATVILTRDNGIECDERNANAIGFMKKTPLSGCTALIKSYFADDI